MRSSCFALLIGMLECYCYDTAVVWGVGGGWGVDVRWGMVGWAGCCMLAGHGSGRQGSCDGPETKEFVHSKFGYS